MVSNSPLLQEEKLDIGSLASDIYSDGPLISRFLHNFRWRIAPINRLVDAIPFGSDVLDVGCGRGLLLNCAARAGRIRKAHGFDSSRSAIELATGAAARLEASGIAPVPTFECRSVELGVPNRTYDVVCLIDVLHHVEVSSQHEAFLLAASCVRPGGIMVYKDMCSAPKWRAGLNRLHDLLSAHQWINYVPIATVDRWASDAGLESESAEWIPMLWYGHELRIYRHRGLSEKSP